MPSISKAGRLTAMTTRAQYPIPASAIQVAATMLATKLATSIVTRTPNRMSRCSNARCCAEAPLKIEIQIRERA